jgi:HEAT repeat protein
LCSILLPWNIRKHLPGLQDRDNIRADAAEAVQALGSSARELAPALLNMLSDEDPNTRAFSTAIKTLNKIGVSDESFDPLLERWRRERRIAQIACFCEVTTLSTTNAALALCALLESNDPSHQLLAYTTLRRMGKNAGPATPVLLQKLDDADVERRYQTVRTLESIGTNAGAALPKLSALLDDTNSMVRTASLRCIKTITGAP